MPYQLCKYITIKISANDILHKNYNKQNYPFCKLKSLVKKFGTNQSKFSKNTQ